jgi:hypothetical protein
MTVAKDVYKNRHKDFEKGYQMLTAKSQ